MKESLEDQLVDLVPFDGQLLLLALPEEGFHCLLVVLEVGICDAEVAEY